MTGSMPLIAQQATSIVHSTGMEATGTSASMPVIHIVHTYTSAVPPSGYPIVAVTHGTTMAVAHGITVVRLVLITTSHLANTT